MVRTQQAAAVRSAGACDAPHEGEQHARVGVCIYGHMCVRIHTTRGRAADTRGCRSPRECARRPACGRANVAPLQRITRTRRMFACAISHVACCTPPGAHCAAAACCAGSIGCMHRNASSARPSSARASSSSRRRSSFFASPCSSSACSLTHCAACAAKPPPACGPWHRQLRSGPAARTRLARGDIAGTARACMRVRRVGALPCMRARACLNACTRRRMHARA